MYAFFSRSRMMVLWPVKLNGCGGSFYIFYFFFCSFDIRIEYQCAGLSWSLEEARLDCSQGLWWVSSLPLYMNYHLAPYFEQLSTKKNKSVVHIDPSSHPDAKWKWGGWMEAIQEKETREERKLRLYEMNEWMKGRRRLTKPKGKAVERRMVIGMYVREVRLHTQRRAHALELFIYFWTWPFLFRPDLLGVKHKGDKLRKINDASSSIFFCFLSFWL